MPYFHNINPIAFSIGPVAVHWYGIMYLLGFIGAWYLGNRRREQGRLAASHEAFSDLAFYAMLGVIVGGRVGYMLFYVSLDWMVHDPLALFRVWEGGMSFHGGLLGVLCAGWLWSRRHEIHFFDTVDFVAPLVPIGLGLGRFGNFIGGGVQGEVPCVEYDDLRIRDIHAIAFRFAGIERAGLAAIGRREISVGVGMRMVAILSPWVQVLREGAQPASPYSAASSARMRGAAPHTAQVTTV